MRKLLNKPWFVALLALGAVVFVGQALLEQRRPPRGRATSASAYAEPGDESDEGRAAGPATLREALQALPLPAQIPDPFGMQRRGDSPGGAAKPAEPDLVETFRLSATWKQDDLVLLLLNGRVCRVGDTVGNVTIESASFGGVWLGHWKGRDFLRVGGDFTLVTPAAQKPAAILAIHEG